MNIAVVSLATPNIESFASLSRLRRVAYCKRHGYTYIDYQDVLDSQKPASWSRLPVLRKALQDGYDYVCWMDADTIITSPEFKLETIIENYSKPDDFIFISKDYNNYNDGVHMLRSCQDSLNLLNDTEEAYPEFKNHVWWSQGAYILLLRLTAYKDKVCEVPCSVWNSYLDIYEYKNTINVWNPESFILHLPAVPAKKRTEIFRKVLNGDFNF